MEPGKPPTESTGSAEMKMVLDGRFLQQEFTGEMMGQPYSGMGISGYDNLRKRYVSTWIDTMGTGVFVMEGTASADGKTITLKGQHAELGGGQMSHRAVWKIVDSNTQTFDMYGDSQGRQGNEDDGDHLHTEAITTPWEQAASRRGWGGRVKCGRAHVPATVAKRPGDGRVKDAQGRAGEIAGNKQRLGA